MLETIDLTGRELGRYRVERLLGAGGMGAVYEAIDVPLDRRIALKILPPELAGDQRRMARFAREARTASALNHPHVISVYDIGSQQIDGRLLQYIAMERVEGTTLRALLANGPLPLERALELMQQIADAVAAAHGAGVIHRDLKPENIMVSRDGYAKVLDFGLAKLQEEATPDATTDVLTTQSGFVLGTPGYMAPEQAEGRPADHRADIFALGCILYELVSGRRAFRGASQVDTLHQVIHSDPEPVAGAPAELQRIVGKALAKDPEARYQSVRELSIDLRQLLRSVRSRQAPRPRRTALWIAAAVAVLLMAAAGIALFVRGRRSPPPPAEHLRRITSTGDVTEAAISPDGRFLAYVVSGDAGQSLWIRQMATQQDLQLVPPARIGFWGHTFTPDGNAIVYGVKSSELPGGSFFRISTLGGRPEHLLDGIDSAPSFSPDGKRMTYARADFPRVGESSLMIASSDGSGARPLATRKYPEVFAPIFFTGPSWSPDGSTIVAAVARADLAKGSDVFAFDVQRGTARALTDRAWYSLGQAAWLPDMSGIVVTGARDADTPPQQRIWLLPYPRGAPRAITNDLLSYRMPTLTADGRSLVAIASDITTQLWSAPLAKGGRPTKITNGRVDGWCLGVMYTSDGRIIFTAAAENSGLDLATTALDGSDRRWFTRSKYGALYPSTFRGGVAFVSTGWDTSEVRVKSLTGDGERVIVRGVDVAPIAASPDGEWIAYMVNGRLWKIRSNGTQATQLFPLRVANAVFSPDGKRLALFYGDRGPPKAGVMSADGGPITWSTPVNYGNSTAALRWTPDGSALLMEDYGPDRANLWRVTFDGRVEKLTALDGDQAYAFDVSPDGKNVVVARGRLTRDAILITEFR